MHACSDGNVFLTQKLAPCTSESPFSKVVYSLIDYHSLQVPTELKISNACAKYKYYDSKVYMCIAIQTCIVVNLIESLAMCVHYCLCILESPLNCIYIPYRYACTVISGVLNKIQLQVSIHVNVIKVFTCVPIKF